MEGRHLSAATQRRLAALELISSRALRPTTAFVIWERTQREADAALDRALAVGKVKRGDPIIMGIMPGPAPLPAARWTDALSMSDGEIDALAELPPTTAVFIGDVRKMTDADLSGALIASVARTAA
jgi:hypothetical protein